MQELIPVAGGLVFGVILGMLRPSLRLWLGGLYAIVLGTLVTVATGEFEISWAFLLIDIPLVGLSAATSLMATRALPSRR